MADNPKQTLIEDGTEFDGSVKSQCAITLSGKVSGELSAPSLVVTPSGSVHGRVKVAELNSQGEVAGEIEAETVELAGQVSDQTVIRANTLEVKLQQANGGFQVTFGNCELQVGENVVARSPKAVTTEDKAPKKKVETPPAAASEKQAEVTAEARKPEANSVEDAITQAATDLLVGRD